MSALRSIDMWPRSGARPSLECAHPRAQRPAKTARHWALARAMRRTCAFTLLELMIVVGIMGLVMTMSVPIVWKVFHRSAMNKAIWEMQELCRNARARAILQGVQTQMVLHGNGGISIEGGAGSAPAATTGESFPAVGVSSSGGTPAATHLPEGVAIFKFLVGGVDCMHMEFARVRFFPNGTCDDFVMQLVSDHSERVEISLEVTTSLASVEHDWGKFRIR